jgi:hypothetical protein
MSEIDDLSQDYGELEELPVAPSSPTDKALEKKFSGGRLRVVQDKNDFFLPHVIDFIEGRKWGNLRPEYQRRLRWDNVKKSRLIESFIMSVPVPPVFLFQNGIGQYEVMDGQQRLNAIVQYLSGDFSLAGLKVWPDLNGRKFGELPKLIRSGLESSKISAITLISDTSLSKKESLKLRAQVFDRLNTGGERLYPQELRNSLYYGRFNNLIVELAGDAEFTSAWDIPNHKDNISEDGNPTERLRENNIYKRMLDCEIVLRFFAFRESSNITGSVKSILDRTMEERRDITPDAVVSYRKAFVETLIDAKQLFGERAFRLPPNPKGQSILSRPLYDAQMIATEALKGRMSELLARREHVASAVQQLAVPGSKTYDLIVGRANTAKAIQDRIAVVISTMLAAI